MIALNSDGKFGRSEALAILKLDSNLRTFRNAIIVANNSRVKRVCRCC